MNYLAHGYRFLNRPAFLVGTAIPDWVSVCDRSLRLDAETVSGAHTKTQTSVEADLVAGIGQHLEDDRWFHSTPRFDQVTRQLASEIRRVIPEPRNFRANFLGHVLAELLLDSALVENQPALLDDYYRAHDRVSIEAVQSVVELTVGSVPTRLAHFVTRFRESEFLRHYTDDTQLFDRIGQVATRAGLPPVPEEFARVIPAARITIRTHAEALLSQPAKDQGQTELEQGSPSADPSSEQAIPGNGSSGAALPNR